MLEIYNEQVNDLLNKDNQKGGLQVRQHPSQGYFYAQDLKEFRSEVIKKSKGVLRKAHQIEQWRQLT